MAATAMKKKADDKMKLLDVIIPTVPAFILSPLQRDSRAAEARFNQITYPIQSSLAPLTPKGADPEP